MSSITISWQDPYGNSIKPMKCNNSTYCRSTAREAKVGLMLLSSEWHIYIPQREIQAKLMLSLAGISSFASEDRVRRHGRCRRDTPSDRKQSLTGTALSPPNSERTMTTGVVFNLAHEYHETFIVRSSIAILCTHSPMGYHDRGTEPKTEHQASCSNYTV